MDISPVQRMDRDDKPESVLNCEPFETWLYSWVQHIRSEQGNVRALTQSSVAVHIRSRGLTISDMMSGWGTRPETNGRFLSYDPNLDGEVHPINIVGPAIRTNRNACLQSNSQTTVTSANESALHKQIAMRWQRFADYYERTAWNESKRGFIFDDVQKGGTDLVEVYCEEADTHTTAKIGEGGRAMAVFHCPQCGQSGLMPYQMPAEGTETPEIEASDAVQGPSEDVEASETVEEPTQTKIPCPANCGAQALAVIKQIGAATAEEGEELTYEICDRTLTSFNFVIDLYGARVGGLQTANWLRTHALRDLNYMQENYPGMGFTGPSMWSFQSRCDYGLARGDWNYFNWQVLPTTYGHERYEEESHYLHEDAYSAYRAPDDYKFVDGKGVTTFSIKAGESIGQAQERCYGRNLHGFKFYWNEERLLNIPKPEGKDVVINFRERFSDVHWNRESGSFLSSPNMSLVYIQDDITLLNTKHHNIIARNDANPVYYNSKVFEKTDFSQEYIGSAKEALLDKDFDVRKAVTALPVPTAVQGVMEQMQWLWSIKDDVSQVTPAMRGESRPGDPGVKARQDLEQSFGNLTSVLKSFAQCKCNTFLNKARVAKEVYTLEQFQRIGSMFGEQWSEDDVREMKEIDFAQDLIVSYEQGSEMPSSPMSREMKFYAALQQLIPFLQIPGLVGTPQMTKILQKIDEYGEFDFDLTGLEVNELIAQKRYNDLSVACEPYVRVTAPQVQIMRTRVVGSEPPSPEAMQQSIQIAQSAPTDPQAMAQAQQLATPTPITELEVIVERVFHQAQIRFSQYEDLRQQQDFFTEVLRAEIGKTKPNYLLIEVLEYMMKMIDAAMQHNQQEAIASDPQAQAAAKADADAKAMDAAKLQLEGEKINVEKAKVVAAQHNAEEDRKVEVQGHNDEMLHGLLTQAADHEAQDSENAHVPDPRRKIVETISFKDLPPVGQVDLAADAGIDITEGQIKAKQEAEKPATPAAKK